MLKPVKTTKVLDRLHYCESSLVTWRLVINAVYCIVLPHPTVFLLGHTVAKQVYYKNKRKDPSKWLPALRLFDVALKLCRTTAVEEHEVEAEILFQKGKMQLGSEL